MYNDMEQILHMYIMFRIKNCTNTSTGTFVEGSFITMNNTRTIWKSNQTGNAIYVSSYITKRQLFTTHGLPEMILLNDATAHASNEFQNFTANNIVIEIYSIRKFERMVCRR
ncbi:hypothetical protein D917_00993 [Trichinella nativa]|uniref:Uncharacterized protein n=1 Tax=Trichinella nativa TaxID=6335 RepID=A0A1Y3EVM2_9BILA|nr:hypothetical protein D917_00993 [Trichinella nativa]